MSNYTLDGLRTSTHDLDRMAAARDLWPGGTLDLFQGRRSPGPDRVLWPASEAEVLQALRWAAERSIPVIPYGAGSGVCGGARGRPGAVVMDLKQLDRIGPLDVERWTVEVEAGVLGQHLEDWLNARGFTLGHSPSSIACSTVGGWAAARSAGQFSSRYGVFEDMVLQLRAVSPARGVVVVGEGGDAPAEWMPLLLGSEGTLAVVTRCRLRVWPLPKKRWLRGYRFPDVERALSAMRQLMQGELWPSAVRLYDPVDTRIGGRTRPKKSRQRSDVQEFFEDWMVEAGRTTGIRPRTLALPLSLPGFINSIFERLATGCLLVVGWEGDPAVVDVASKAGHALLCEQGEDLGAGPGERWYHSRHAVSYKMMPIFERGGFADTMEVAARWSDMMPMYTAIRRALRKTTVVMAHMSHVYPEGGSIYFSFAGRGDRQVYDRTWQAALEAVLASGGTVTHHHGVGMLKARAASAELGPAIEGYRQLKTTLDPTGVLNPGRLFVEVPYRHPPNTGEPAPTDGLMRANDKSAEPMFAWEHLPAPPRWQRCPWQQGWTTVEGRVDGKLARLGRGPRSAAGSDLRGWLFAQGAALTWVPSSSPEHDRWLGAARPERPWAVARSLLRADLRPAVLTVEPDGTLLVGFRGLAAQEFGALARERVPGGLRETPWRQPPMPAGELEACSMDDPHIVAVTLHGALRRRLK